MGETPASSVGAVAKGLESSGYLADEGLSTAVFLALRMHQPLFLEGESGVGKTSVALALADWTGGRLVRLQCYEGIDAAQALYEWDYTRQLLHIRAAEAAGAIRTGHTADLEDELYSERFLVRRPVLDAISAGADTSEPVPVLLIDEIDRADDEFEAFLLEVLADYSVTVPEVGTIRAERPPVVVVTSNRTRDVHDALKRRCLYHWVDHPTRDREIEVIRLHVPGATDRLAAEVTELVRRFRELGLYKPPGVAESIDWARALSTMEVTTVDRQSGIATLGAVLKYREDQARVIDDWPQPPGGDRS